MTTTTHRVLIVDDYADAVTASCMLFGVLGYRTMSARCGIDALAVTERFHPDVVVLDIGLPDLSGYEVARELRARHGNALFIAALTGWGQGVDRVRAIAAGFDMHLLKPASVEVLRGIISAAEEHHRRRLPAGDS